MSYLYRLAPAAAWLALSAVTTLAHAPDKTRPHPDVADVNASVPATAYQAVMTYRPAAPGISTPAQNWKALNAQVASYDSMTLTMGNASSSQAEAMTAKTGAVSTATAAHPRNHAPAAVPAPDPHAHHTKGDAK